jgi:hypothetical protein
MQEDAMPGSKEQFHALDENLQTTSPAPAFAQAELN